MEDFGFRSLLFSCPKCTGGLSHFLLGPGLFLELPGGRPETGLGRHVSGRQKPQTCSRATLRSAEIGVPTPSNMHFARNGSTIIFWRRSLAPPPFAPERLFDGRCCNTILGMLYPAGYGLSLGRAGIVLSQYLSVICPARIHVLLLTALFQRLRSPCFV